MGYDLHITRAESWEKSAEQPIALQELISLAQQDPHLHVWVSWSGHTEGKREAWFYYHDGLIGIKNPDEQTIAKTIEIAKKLNAHVQGDSGESYGAPLQKKSFWKKIIN